MSPLVSLITVCYNSASTIADTFESVLAQEHRPLEYLIIDGASTDDTMAIAEKYRPRFEAKGIDFRASSEPDDGLYDAMNKGIRQAQGELIGIVNSDDWYEPDTVATAVEAYAQNPENVVYGMLRIYKEERLYMLRQYTHHFLHEHICQHPTWFVPRKLYDKYGLFDTQYRVAGDFDLAQRLRQAGVGFTRLEKVMSNFRIGGNSTQSDRGFLEYAEIRYKYGIISKEERDGLRLRYRYGRLKSRVRGWLMG